MAFLFGRYLDISLIDLEERALGVHSPESYKTSVRSHDGAVSNPAGVRFINPQSNTEEIVSCSQLIPFQENEEGSMTMAQANRELIPFLPIGTVVFGMLNPRP